MSRPKPPPRSGDRSKAVITGVTGRLRVNVARCRGRPVTHASAHGRTAGPDFDKCSRNCRRAGLTLLSTSIRLPAKPWAPPFAPPHYADSARHVTRDGRGGLLPI